MIRAHAPTRADLAGGTIDIWPVCFVLGKPAVTVNLALSLRAHAEVEATHDGFLEVISEDRDETVRLPADAVTHERLGLATRLAAYFGIGDGLRIRLHSTAPPGSGLGGSSTLMVALAGALARLRGGTVDLRAVQNIETALLGAPTGYQDYYPALHGGLNVLTAVPEGVSVEPIESGGAFLRDHLLLADTRIEHHSGMNNWEAVKRFLDGDPDVRASFRAIRDCAERMAAALRARDLDIVARSIDEEWDERRRLSPVVSNDRIEELSAAARAAGALASKICGAGGGGCLLVLVGDDRERVEHALVQAGGAILDVSPDPHGLTVA